MSAIVLGARVFSCKYITTRLYLQKHLYRCLQSRPRYYDSIMTIEIGQTHFSFIKSTLDTQLIYIL